MKPINKSQLLRYYVTTIIFNDGKTDTRLLTFAQLKAFKKSKSYKQVITIKTPVEVTFNYKIKVH